MKYARGLGFATIVAAFGCSDYGNTTTPTSLPNVPKVETIRQPVSQSFAASSLIIPMDTAYQDYGMLKAYGLVYKLLANGVPVKWVIKTGKAAGGVDFTASARDFQTNATISNHGYRGGPFVIDATNRAAALPIVRAWHSAGNVTAVHDATAAFTGDVRRSLTSAPRLGVFADGYEVIASMYLNAAGIRDSAGQTWPTNFDQTRAYAGYPDMIDTNEVSGTALGGSADGALVRADETPIFCHLSSMHYGLPTNDEVVHEVRHWLRSSPYTHAFMSCEAISDFENNAARGKYLTTGGASEDGHDIPDPLKNLVPDHPLSQFDGDLEATQGAVQSLGLNSGSSWRPGVEVLLAKTSMTSGNPTNRVMWVTGNFDGNAAYGRVSYMTGHGYQWNMPVSQNEMANAIRLYLNTLFESTCAVAEAEPQVVVTVSGPSSTAAQTFSYDVTVENRGGGVAVDVGVAFALPSGMTFVSATGGGTLANGTVSWSVGSLRAGASITRQVTVSVTTNATFSVQLVVTYRVGVTVKTVRSNTFSTTWTGVVLETTLLGYPHTGTSTSATFTFASNVAGATFECTLNAPSNWAACVSGVTYTNLAVGSHYFYVRAKDSQGNIDATPAQHAWVVNAAAPDTTVNSGPPALTNSTLATFTFSSTGNSVTFECKFDNGNFASCASALHLVGFADGTHTFYVRAKDPAGNVDPTPATHTWTVDTTPPDTGFAQAPPGSTTSTTETIRFFATESGVVYECKLDNAVAFTSCANPITLTGLTAGPHTFYVRSRDAAGNVDPAPAIVTWVLVLPTPDTYITGGPPALTNATVATFTFSSSASGATFECKLDGAPAFTACTTPVTYTGLAQGVHTLSVRSRDSAGNTDPTPATHSWTIDASAPETSFAQLPANPSTVSTATFVFTSNESGVTYECKLDGALSFTACSNPYSLTGLTDGAHALEVRAKDALGNVDPTPARHAWTIDTAAPTVAVVSGPPTQTTDTAATFDFSSNEAPVTYECELDGSSTFVACGDPATFTGVAVGTHTLTVRARDAAGNVSASPARYTWTVAPNAPETTITSAPPGVTSSAAATFVFASTLAGSTFECKVDSALSFTACAATLTILGLADGPHVVEVRARSAAGVVDPTPARHDWIVVSSVPPETDIVSGPSGAVDVATATFELSSNKNPVTFECRLDGATTWTACPSRATFVGLSEGAHTLEVRAKDAAGNVDPTPATTSWIVDTAASPETVIVSGPPATDESTSATFDLSSSDASATFECSLDGAPWTDCTDPAVINNLAIGSHALSVRAKDSDGDVDPTPATYSWAVTPPSPTTDAGSAGSNDGGAVVEGDAGAGTGDGGTAIDPDGGSGNDGGASTGDDAGTGSGDTDAGTPLTIDPVGGNVGSEQSLDVIRHGGGGCAVSTTPNFSAVAGLLLLGVAAYAISRPRRARSSTRE